MLIKELATIILLSVFLAFIYNTFSSKGLPLIRKSPQKIAASDSALFSSSTSIMENKNRLVDSLKSLLISKSESPEVYKVVTLEQLQRLLSEHRGYLIDARDSASYNSGHIKGAVNFPGNEPEKYFESLLQIPTDTLVIIYCNNPECHLGHDLIEFMKTLGFNNLYLYDDGWDGWIRASMPIEKSTSG